MIADAALTGGDADRIVVLHARVVARRGGGPEKTVLSSPAYFEGTPYRPVAVYLHPRRSVEFADLEAMARRARCELVGVPESGPVDPRAVFALLRICRERGVTIWHGHDYKSNLLGLVLRRFHPMRLVTTLHGWCDLDLRTRLYFAIDRLCLPHYERVFCVSTDLADEARRCGVPAERVAMLRNGIDGERFARTSPPADAPMRRECGVPAGRQVVGALGRLEPVKGFDLAIEAFARLLSEGVDAELWIAGDGSERVRLERLARELGAADRVRFLGHREDVRPMLEACDAVVSASYREGTPNVLLEALAMEVAVVAPGIAGVPALVRDGETGILFRVGEVAGLVSGLRRLLENSSLRSGLARAGRDLVLAEFSFQERARVEAQAYDRLLGLAVN